VSLVTLLSVTVIFCTSVTPLSFTVIVLPEKVGLPCTLPLPLVTAALPLTTLLLKVKTKVNLPPVLRHSTPGSPASGKGTSKVPAVPWVMRETAEVSERLP
jgi:hypothetical protein